MKTKELHKIIVIVSPELEDALSYQIFEMGIGGVEMEKANGQSLVISYIEGDPGEYVANLKEYLTNLADFFPEAQNATIETERIEGDDWAHAWKKFFKPFEVTSRIVIKPTWETYQIKPGQIILEVDPQMAFGTGGHETTRMCIQELDRLAGPDMQGLLKFKKVLDLGTGTGILAIVATKLGAPNVLGIDNDPIAVETAIVNCEQNHVNDRCRFSHKLLAEIKEDFGLVVANITGETLCEISDELAAVQSPGAVVILTGILTERAKQVEECFSALGYEDFVQKKDAEWTLFTARKAT